MGLILDPYRFVTNTPVVSDSFNRANSFSPLGDADTGQTWGVSWLGSSPTWGITSNRAYQSTNGSAAGFRQTFATIDSGVSDIDVSVEITTAQSGNAVQAGIVFRYQNVTNFNRMGLVRNSDASLSLILQKCVSGSFTNLFTPVTPGGLTGTLRVVDNGSNSIEVFLDGVSQGTSSDTANSGQTKQGMFVAHSSTVGAGSGLDWRFDNYQVLTP